MGLRRGRSGYGGGGTNGVYENNFLHIALADCHMLVVKIDFISLKFV